MVVERCHQVNSQVRPYGPIRPEMLVGFDNQDGSNSIGTLQEIIWTTPHTVNGRGVRTCIVRPLETLSGAPNWAVQAWQLYRVAVALPPRTEDAVSFQRRIVETLATEPHYLHKLECGHAFWSEYSAAAFAHHAFCGQCFRPAHGLKGEPRKC